MRRYKSDSVLHLVKCRLCRERAHVAHFPTLHELEHEQMIDAATEENSRKEETATFSSTQMPTNWKEEAHEAPIKWQSCNNNTAVLQPSSSNQSKPKLTKNYSNNENLAKILNKWPFARLEEMVANLDADGEFVEVCKMELTRRRNCYLKWNQQWNRMREAESIG